MKMRIAPSVLAADFARLGDEVRAVAEGGADYIHVDVMDGRFVPNITIGQPVVAALRRATDLPLDVHLMIERPELHLEALAEAGADLLTVHVEACPHLHRTLQQIRQLGKRAGVAVNPATSLESLRWILTEVDLVLLMSVNPGFGGQKFIPATLERLRRLRVMMAEQGATAEVEVDGGVGVDNVGEVAAAGANVLVAGTGVFAASDYGVAIGEMRRRAERAVAA